MNTWLREPMNYARIMELPLTEIYLELSDEHSVLDISSPKLLSFLFSFERRSRLVVSDISDYFVEDFKTFLAAGANAEILTFDASQEIPFPDATFDRIFSISVFEHIIGDGDALAVGETLRVLKPGGKFVMTVPVYPTYMEEWQVRRSYWHDTVALEQADGQSDRVFFQRRYDRDAAQRRLIEPAKGSEVEVKLVAERPIAPPLVGDDGLLQHNSYLARSTLSHRLIRKVARRLSAPSYADYRAERFVSLGRHYLTKDWSDPNIRQAVLTYRKL